MSRPALELSAKWRHFLASSLFGCHTLSTNHVLFILLSFDTSEMLPESLMNANTLHQIIGLFRASNMTSFMETMNHYSIYNTILLRANLFLLNSYYRISYCVIGCGAHQMNKLKADIMIDEVCIARK